MTHITIGCIFFIFQKMREISHGIVQKYKIFTTLKYSNRYLLKLKGPIANFFLEILRIVKTIICKGPGNGCFYIDFADKIGKIIFELSTEF